MIIEATGVELEPTPWTRHAACKGCDPELWFPRRGAGTREAVNICATCPVAAECLDYALRWRIIDGVWGGKTGDQRDMIRRCTPDLHKPRRLPAPHGTTTRYARGCRCQECRNANQVAAEYRKSPA